jgi:hypothetical protein
VLTVEQFEKLKIQAEKDLTIKDDFAALNKSKDISSIHQRYISLLTQEILTAKHLGIKRARLYQKLYHQFKFENNFTLDSSKEIEVYINGHEDMIIVETDLALQQTVVRFLEDTCDNLKRLAYTLKTYLDMKKFLAGC